MKKVTLKPNPPLNSKSYKVAIIKGKFKGLIGWVYFKMNDDSGVLLKREFSNNWYLAKKDEIRRFE